MLEKQEAIVFYSSAMKRRYFSKYAAIQAEARAIILKKYPPEPYDRNTGEGCDIRYDEPERYTALHERLCRFIKRNHASKVIK